MKDNLAFKTLSNLIKDINYSKFKLSSSLFRKDIDKK